MHRWLKSSKTQIQILFKRQTQGKKSVLNQGRNLFQNDSLLEKIDELSIQTGEKWMSQVVCLEAGSKFKLQL